MSVMVIGVGGRGVRWLVRAGVVGVAVCLAAVMVSGVGSLVAGAWAGEVCPNAALRTGSSAGLPDCRAFEQVSPSEKDEGSGGVLNYGFPGLDGFNMPPLSALADGSGVTYPGEPFFDPQAPEQQVYTSVRAADGWGTVNGDTLAPEEVPVPILPESASTAGVQVLEETRDGSRVFFLDEANLIPGVSNSAPGKPDLYEYDVPGRQLVDLTMSSPEHADARGIVGVGGEGSEEGSYVYFVAGGILAPGAHAGGCGQLSGGRAIGEGCNLYLHHGGVTRFVVALPEQDEEGIGNAGTLADWVSLPAKRTAEVSPDGRFVVFVSSLALVGGPVGVYEVFRYDSRAGADEAGLVCVSCTSEAGGQVSTEIVGYPQTAINGAYRPRYVLSDGRVFFTTAAALVPQDTNGEQDVYEWQDGAPHLISPGTARGAFAVFADASADGSDVFFTTRQSLVPGDGDEINDLYDARENGGFPSPPPPECEVEAACPGASVAPPVLAGVPVSVSFSGSEGSPSPVVPPTPPRMVSTRTQRLARALKVCRAMTGRHRRLVCEARARKAYGRGSAKTPVTTRKGR
jgi:hypothetical protein